MVARVTATSSGDIEATTTEQGWLEIPEGLDRAEQEAWAVAAAEELRSAWGDGWDERAEAMVPTMLRAAVEERPDSHLVFEVWPYVAPARARVRISMTERDSLPDWASLGFSIVPYDGAVAGPGVTVVRRRAVTDEDGQGVQLVDWGAVFDDGERALFVQVDTVPLFVFNRITIGLHQLVSGLRVTLPGGAPFRARPSEHALIDDGAEWTALRMQAEGLLGGDEVRG